MYPAGVGNHLHGGGSIQPSGNKMYARTPPKITPLNPKVPNNEKAEVPEVIYDGIKKITYQRGRFMGKVF